jgi:hypothetical protein
VICCVCTTVGGWVPAAGAVVVGATVVDVVDVDVDVVDVDVDVVDVELVDDVVVDDVVVDDALLLWPLLVTTSRTMRMIKATPRPITTPSRTRLSRPGC